MVSMIRLLGPGALLGGVGAALLCGAGAASADTGADAGPGQRAAQAAASTSAAERPGRTARAVSLGAAAPRSAAAAPVSDSGPRSAPAPAAAVPAAPARVSPARVVRTRGNDGPVVVTPPAVAVPVVPSSVPVDPAQFAGTYYEQGSVKQFFNFGLVNTKAVYTVKPDGTLGVQNSGNYFAAGGPQSSITGAAVPVNALNTALNVGFGGTPAANPPGNYLIIDRAPDYSWVIVSDPSGRSGFILTRSQAIGPQAYRELLARARELGVQGRITPTTQIV